MSRRLTTLILGAASLALPFNAASAHEQAIGLTEVSFIAPETASASCLEQTCRVEVAHRYSIHDAESTLMHVLGARADLVGDAEAQRKFADYVASQFTLTDVGTGEAIALTLLGGEVERGYFWVYQEGELAPAAAGLTVLDSVLMDVIPQQTNRVNLKHQGQVDTLVFSGPQRPQAYRFD